jgi:meiotic recombination protein SPO11
MCRTVMNAQYATWVLVVEKDAIFQRLTDDRIWELLPCIIITARGMPDFATRIFLK